MPIFVYFAVDNWPVPVINCKHQFTRVELTIELIDNGVDGEKYCKSSVSVSEE